MEYDLSAYQLKRINCYQVSSYVQIIIKIDFKNSLVVEGEEVWNSTFSR